MGVVEEKIFVPGTLCLSFTKQIFSLFSLCSFFDVSIEPGVKKETNASRSTDWNCTSMYESDPVKITWF